MDAQTDVSGPSFANAGVVELRQYTLHPGARDTLVRVFEDHFIEGQQRAGIRVGGTYLDEKDPDRFVWLRGFTDLDQRVEALESFYFGPIWAAHRDAANATMIDSDDVLLLRPTVPPHRPLEPAPSTDAGPREDRVHVSAYVFEADPELERWLSTELHGVLERMLDTSVASWRSHPGPNGFPQLPVRDDNAYVWAASFPNGRARQRALDRLHSSPAWTNEMAPRLRRYTAVQDLALRPTHRSEHPRPGTRFTTDAEEEHHAHRSTSHRRTGEADRRVRLPGR
jgi:hypothetical protein